MMMMVNMVFGIVCDTVR